MKGSYNPHGQELRTSKVVLVTEGETVDGRTITAQMCRDMAETYQRSYYEAALNREHAWGYLGFVEDGLEYVDHPLLPGKRCLMGCLAPNSDFLYYSRQGYINYLSIEWVEDFRNTGKAYLVGLGCLEKYPGSVGVSKINLLSKSSPMRPRPLPGGLKSSDLNFGTPQEFSLSGNSERKEAPARIFFESAGEMDLGHHTLHIEQDMKEPEVVALIDSRMGQLQKSLRDMVCEELESRRQEEARKRKQLKQQEQEESFRKRVADQEKQIETLSKQLATFLSKEAPGQDGQDVTDPSGSVAHRYDVNTPWQREG